MLHVTPSIILYFWLYVAINVSQKSAKFLLTELSNITQVSPHAFSLLSAAGASQPGTENNLNVCTDCSVLPKFFGYWMVIETLVIQDPQCWAVFIDLYSNPATFTCSYILGSHNQYSGVRTSPPKILVTTHFYWFLKSLTKVAAELILYGVLYALSYFKEWLLEQVECVASWVLLRLESSQNNQGAKLSRQFSISTIKPKSLAKLSMESRLRTTNEKGMTQIGLCYKETKLSISCFWTKFPAWLYHCISFIPRKNLSQHTATSAAAFRFSSSGNLGKLKWS